MDTSKLVTGAIIRLAGRVVEMPKPGRDAYEVLLYGQTKSHLVTPIDFAEMNAAELISLPKPKFTKEQVKAIEQVLPRYVVAGNGIGNVMQLHIARELYKFLDENMASS